MKKTIIISVIIAVAVGSGSFYAGMLCGKKQAGDWQNNFRQTGQIRLGQGAGPGGQLNNRQGRGSASFLSGEIIAKDDKSITVKLQDGGSKIVFLSTSVQVTKSVSGSLGDLTAGENVMINGSANADGSLTAQTIQLRNDQTIK